MCHVLKKYIYLLHVYINMTVFWRSIHVYLFCSPPPSLHFSCLPLERNILARHWKLVPLSRFVLGLSSRYHSCPPYDRSVVSSNIFNKQFKSWWKLHVNVFMITEHCLRISHWSIWPKRVIVNQTKTRCVFYYMCKIMIA